MVRVLSMVLVVAMLLSAMMVQAFAAMKEPIVTPQATSSESVSEYWNGWLFTSNTTYSSGTNKFTCTTTWGQSAGIYAKVQPYYLNGSNAAMDSPIVEYETLGYSASASQGPYYYGYNTPYFAKGTSRVTYNGQTKTGSSKLNFYA